MKLNLGCGFRPEEGYVNIDNREEVSPDLVCDITKGLPYEDDSVDEVRAFDFLEHIPIGETIKVIEEIWRVLKPGGKFESFTPSTDGRGAFQDPTHVSFWNMNSWLYYSHPAYRALYGIKANFELETCRNVPSEGNIIHTYVVAKAKKDAGKIRVAVISANLGQIDPDFQTEHVKQNLPDNMTLDFFNFTDKNYPPRIRAMKPRLQAKIPRMMGWMLKPGYDFYIWMDSAITLKHKGTIQWLVSQCLDADIALYKHPLHSSIQEERMFIQQEMSAGNGYLLERFEGEFIHEQVETYLKDPEFEDDKIYASGVFIYRNTEIVKKFMSTWLMHCLLYSTNDQTSFPYVMAKNNCKVKRIDGNIYENEYFTYHHRGFKEDEYYRKMERMV